MPLEPLVARNVCYVKAEIELMSPEKMGCRMSLASIVRFIRNEVALILQLRVFAQCR